MDSQEYLWIMPPSPQQPVVKLAAAARLLFSWTDSHVKIWRVEEINEAEFEGDDRIEKRYLLEMEFNVSFISSGADYRTKRIFQRLLYPRMESIF